MKYFGAGLSESHKELNRIIRKPELIEQTKELFLEIHGKLHLPVVSGNERNEVDELVGDLREDEYAIMPTAKDETIAWVLWHISRIEDLTMNILVNGEKQIFNEDWQTRMNSPIRDTGNALSDNQIIQLSKSLRIQELLEYRNEVGRKSREIIQTLSPDDIRRKIPAQRISRILEEGGITNHEDSIWLLDFWAKKDIAGILLMPPTRHVMLHLNDCCKWKLAIRGRHH